MKSVLKKIVGNALTTILVFGMFNCSNGNNNNPVAETVATPTFSVSAGEVEIGTNVIITCPTEGAKIFYSIDGNEIEEYTSAIIITEEVTIVATATKDRMNDSSIVSARYTIKDFPLISAGTFLMGSNQGEDSNKPVHEVTLTNAFYMCDHEVTQKEYETIMKTNPSFHVGDVESVKVADGEIQENRPVEQVNWYMAIVYCNKRSIKEGLVPCYSLNGETDPTEWSEVPTTKENAWDMVECNWNVNGYRLPTEAEWEYAARAGDTSIDTCIWSGTTVFDNEYFWHAWNSNYKTHEVKLKKPNSWNLYDMSGNVWEWCWDWWPEKGTYSSESVTNPRGDTTSTGRVFRGGSCDNAYDIAIRNVDIPLRKHSYTGFRVCRTSTK